MKDINQYILEKFKISKSTIENDHIQTGDKAIRLEHHTSFGQSPDFEFYFKIVTITNVNRDMISYEYPGVVGTRCEKIPRYYGNEFFIGKEDSTEKDSKGNKIPSMILVDKEIGLKGFKSMLSSGNRVFYTDKDKIDYLLNGFTQDDYKEKLNKLIKELSE